MTLEKLLKKHGIKVIEVKDKAKHIVAYPSIVEIYTLLIKDAAQFFDGKKKVQYADICELLTRRGCTKNEFEKLCASLDQYKNMRNFPRCTGIALSTIVTVLPAKMTIDVSSLSVPPDYLCTRLADKEYTLIGEVGRCFGFQTERSIFHLDGRYGDSLGKETSDCTFYIKDPYTPHNIPPSNSVYYLKNGKWRRGR